MVNYAARSNPKIAVLLAAFNGLEWIDAQIVSILNQQDVDVKIFVSVDLSSDGTELWIKELASKELRVELLPYGDVFGSACMNFFRLMRDVEFREFDAVAFADQDDIWFPNKLIRAYKIIETNAVKAVSSDIIAFWKNGKRKVVKKSYPQRIFDHYFEAAGPGCTYVLERNSAIILQRFLNDNTTELKNINHHDWFIYAFFRNAGLKWYIDPSPTMLYRQHDNNQVGANIGYKAYFERLKLINNKGYRQQVDHFIKLIAPQHSQRFQNYWFLVLNSFSFRRRPRDRFILFLLCILKIY